MSTSITSREFFQAVLDASASLDGKATFGSVHMSAEEMRLFAENAISKLDTRNEARKSKPSKDSIESAARRASVRDFFTAAGSELVCDRDTVATNCGMTPGQATAALTALVKSGCLVRIEGKGKTKTCYKLA